MHSYYFRFFSFVIFLLSFISVFAQESLKIENPDSLPLFRMSEIVVTGERIPVIESATIHEISTKQISNLDIKSVNDALAYSPGIYFSRTTKNENTFKLRGFEQRQVSVFLDGIPITVPYDGVIDISQISGDNLEQIRVSRGISSILYGANTLGGTVNIITANPVQNNQLNLRLEGSNHNRFFSSINFRGSFNKFRMSLSASYDKSDDYKLSESFTDLPNQSGSKRSNSDFEKKSVSLKLQYNLNTKNNLGLQFSAIDNKYNIPPNASVERPRYWQFPDWKKNIFSLNTESFISDNLILRSVWFYDNYYNQLKSYDDDTYSTQTRRYAFNSKYDDYSLGSILYPQFNLFSFGSTNSVLSFKKDVHREKSTGDNSFSEYAIATWTIGMEQDVLVSKNINSSVGWSVNYLQPTKAAEIELREPITLVNGQLAVQYSLFPSVNLNFAAGNKSRFPTLKELYSERLSRNIANPELKPEYSFNTELGIQYTAENMNLQISLFSNQLTGLIANQQLENNIQQLQNTGKAFLRGFEINGENQIFNSSMFLNYTYLISKNESKNRTSKYLEYRPVHRLNLIWQKEIFTNFFAHLETSYTADQKYQNPDTIVWEDLNDFFTLNLKINYNLYEYANIYLRINNAFDKNYFSQYGIPMPGREFVTGVKLQI
ncbi:MAG: TonB-dependent receptor [Calditrichia bacterium]|nr:TonB-dependent receptor [Calditrichia bacterium]